MAGFSKKQSNALLKTRTYLCVAYIHTVEVTRGRPHAQTEAAIKAAEREITISGLIDLSRRVGAAD